MGSSEGNDFSGFLKLSGTHILSNHSVLIMDWQGGALGLTNETTLGFALREPGVALGSNSSVNLGFQFLSFPRLNWHSQDAYFNRPFQCAVLNSDGDLVLSGAVESLNTVMRSDTDHWHESAWFGYHYRELKSVSFSEIGDDEKDYPKSSWIYHVDHQWLYASEFSASGSYHFDYGLQAWVWASAKIYPWLYAAGEGWLYYLDDAEGRWFYSSASSEWRFVAD